MSSTKHRKPNSGLTADDLCSIIKACSENGVHLLKLSGEVEIHFGGFHEDRKLHGAPFQGLNEPYLGPNTEILGDQTQKIDVQTIEQQEVESKEERLARMSIEDPAEFERLMYSGELEHDAQA